MGDEHAGTGRGSLLPLATELQADCSSCTGLCCVAMHFTASDEFAADKPAGVPCEHLGAQNLCTIHTRLREKGYVGCTVFDCYGAGQKISQHTFDGQDWRTDPDRAARIFSVFPVMLQLHEHLWHLTQALDLAAAAPLHPELRTLALSISSLTDRPAADLLRVTPHLRALRTETARLLKAASALARADASPRTTDAIGPDLVGATLAGADLRGADMSGTLLMRADLRGADLRLADLRNAALTNADLRGADLRDCLFLTRSQLSSARYDAHTRLSTSLRPEGREGT